MPGLIIVAVVGFIAQLIDGGMGMGYGVISSSLLLTAGIAPAAAAASVQLSAVGTTLASGVSHWRFGNVDWHVIPRIAVPGALGAFGGATLLSWLPAQRALPWTSGILFAMGGYLLIRFSRHRAAGPAAPATRVRSALLVPLGLVAGTVTAMGGGGWGPIATSTLLASGKLDPKKTVGSVSAAEFAVSSAAGAGFLIGLSGAIVWPVVIPLLIGGVIAAPMAAWLIRKLPT
ncbi:MAG: sulfite exporter TauE/SafE family protein, partial [Stackebrandtia sp.]